MIRTEKVIVTGGNGFIGRNLVERLSQNPSFEVFSVDINHLGLSKKTNVQYLECDLTDAESVKDLPPVDYVFHLAAINGTQRFYSEPWHVFYNSLVSTMNIVNHYKANSELKRFVYTSSSEVYADRISGEGNKIKSNESIQVGFDNVLNPRWSYGGAKLAGEIAVNAASIEYGLKFTIIRYHNIYGPNMGINHVIPDFIGRARKGVYKLFGGNNVRSFMHISDALSATLLVGFSNETEGKIVHIGNEEPVTMIELAEIIMKTNNWIGHIEIENAPEGSTNYRCPDTSYLKKTLGFTSEFDLASGIKNCVESEKWEQK
jgi:UDP-glucose 4-epimerase